MKIAFLNYFDLQNPETWSKSEFGFISTNYHKAKALEQFAQVEYICKLEYPVSPRRSHLINFKRNTYALLDQNYIHWATPHLSQNLAAQIAPRIAAANVDLVVSSDTTLVAKLDIVQPIILWTTNLFSPLIDRYPDYSNLCRETIWGLRQFDRLALQRCQHLIFPSQWAADNARTEFGVTTERLHVVPYGANNAANDTQTELEQAIWARPRDRYRLLFIGVDWQRKGGALVLEVVRQLQAAGIPTELTIVGTSIPETEIIPPGVQEVGFIDRFSPSGQAQLHNLLRQSHFLLLPSVAETYGNVLCEANSFGVPVIATPVDGISEIVRPGINGYSFQHSQFVTATVQCLSQLFQTQTLAQTVVPQTLDQPYDNLNAVLNLNHRPNRYLNNEPEQTTDLTAAVIATPYTLLAQSALREYQTRLNWSVASQQMQQILTRILATSDRST